MFSIDSGCCVSRLKTRPKSQNETKAMTTAQTPIAVGAPDPEHKTSPILDEYDEDFPILAQQIEELPACYFNSVAYKSGTFVCSGSGELLRCEKGIWVQEGSCDPDNP
jgi:hypothetical protein